MHYATLRDVLKVPFACILHNLPRRRAYEQQAKRFRVANVCILPAHLSNRTDKQALIF